MVPLGESEEWSQEASRGAVPRATCQPPWARVFHLPRKPSQVPRKLDAHVANRPPMWVVGFFPWDEELALVSGRLEPRGEELLRGSLDVGCRLSPLPLTPPRRRRGPSSGSGDRALRHAPYRGGSPW